MNLPEGSTPLTSNDLKGLLQLAETRTELDAYEQANIVIAERWSFRSNTIKNNLLEVKTIKLLHKKMFDQVWEWAGQYRQVQTNIGVEAPLIQSELFKLFDKVKGWIQYRSYSNEEIAVRFHHGLVWIHPFPNGNGRYARLSADLLLFQLENKRLSWGKRNLISKESRVRIEYLEALREADQRRFERLLEFSI